MPGFDKSKFKNLTKNESEQLMCGICLEILRNPYITKCCGQAYCRDCIEECINKVKTCPNDRKSLTLNDINPPPLLVKNMLNSLEIYCRFKNNGCDEVKTVEFIEIHEKECKFNPEATCCYCLAINGESIEHNCVDNLKIKLNHLKQKYDDIEKSYNLFKIESGDEITILKQNLETTEIELILKMNSEENMLTEIKKLKSELLDSQKENHKLKISIEKTTKISENLTNQIEKLQTDLVNYQEVNENLAKDFKKSDLLYEKLNIKHCKCLKFIESLKNDNATLKEELKTEANSNIASKERVDILEQTLSQKNNNEEIIIIQVKKLEEKILDSESENKSLKSTINKLSTSTKNLEKSNKRSLSEINNLTQANEFLKGQSMMILMSIFQKIASSIEFRAINKTLKADIIKFLDSIKGDFFKFLELMKADIIKFLESIIGELFKNTKCSHCSGVSFNNLDIDALVLKGFELFQNFSKG